MDQGQVRLGLALGEIMASKGWTDARLAAAIGKSQQRVTDYRGGALSKMEQVAAIEDALGLRRGELLVRAGYVEASDMARAVVAAAELPEAAKTTILAIYDAMASSDRSGGSGMTSA